jgi:uncharacterized membrane protein
MLLAANRRMAWETVIGRSLAFGLHPVAAWPRISNRARAAMVAAYCSASYAIVLGLLFLGRG